MRSQQTAYKVIYLDISTNTTQVQKEGHIMNSHSTVELEHFLIFFFFYSPGLTKWDWTTEVNHRFALHFLTHKFMYKYQI